MEGGQEKWLYKGYIRAMGNILWLLHSYLFCRVCSLVNTYAIYSDSGNGKKMIRMIANYIRTVFSQ